MQPAKKTPAVPVSEIRKAVDTAINATERGDYSGALQLFRLVQKNTGRDVPVRALSYYGLCLVKAEKQTKQGIELAETARTQEFFESRHWANLVRIYLAGGSRRRAVTILQEGLQKMPNDPTLMKLRTEIGYRSSSPFPFLHRDNILNVYFGKRRHLLHPSRTTKIVVGVLWFLALMAATLYFLFQNSGF